MDIQFIDNSQVFKDAMREAVLRALERCGMQAEGYAKDLCPVAPENGGALRDSISHKVVPDDSEVYVGTNSEYGAYVELGTGIYYPGGRQTPWAYQDAKGQWYRTQGQEAQPYLKPAVADHRQTYLNIIKDEMKGE